MQLYQTLKEHLQKHNRHLFVNTGTISKSSNTFVSQAAYDDKVHEQLGLEKMVLPVRGIRKLTKKDMKLNSETPEITVDPQTYEVRVNGELITCEPVDTVPMGQRYFLF